MMIKRSPFFYVGDKYKLMAQLNTLFPANIKRYFEPFMGGGSSLINTKSQAYYVNDIDKHVVDLHKYFYSYKNNRNKLLNKILTTINKYNLTCTYEGYKVPTRIKEKFPKTYFAHINKKPYEKLKSDYNKKHDFILLYLLLIYGFNHMIRFNSKGKFNLPVGNVDFNKNVVQAINSYFDFIDNNNINFSNEDYVSFIKNIRFKKGDFIYFDPPYLISQSEYNSLWNLNREKELYALLDDLNKNGILWGVTNLIEHKGKENTELKKWANKYNTYFIKSNYISYNDNSIKKDSKEIYVTNYGKSNS